MAQIHKTISWVITKGGCYDGCKGRGRENQRGGFLLVTDHFKLNKSIKMPYRATGCDASR